MWKCPLGHMGNWGWFVWVVILAVVIWIVAARPRAGRQAEETPLEIVKRRYAKGEISREEFERMKKDLES